MTRRLTIGFVIDDSLDSTDGVQQYVKTLASWLTAQGHDCHFIVPESKETSVKVHALSRVVRTRFNKNSVATPLPARKRLIKQLFALETFDVLHVQMPYSPVLAGRVIAAMPQQTALIGTFHILPFGKRHRIANRALAKAINRSLKRFDQVVSVSDAAQAFAKESYGIDSEVLPNAVDTKSFVSKRSLQPHPRKRIVFLGRLVERKGAAELLKALNVLQTLQPTVASGIECIIAGGGALRPKLEDYVKRHKLEHMVTFMGFIDEKEKPSLLSSADIAVFPSLGGESFGIVLIEAMAAGAGVVLGGDNAGYRSVLGARSETLFDPRDTKHFANTLFRFLQHEQLRHDVHRWQRQHVRQYDVAQVGRKLLSYYEEAISKRTKG